MKRYFNAFALTCLIYSFAFGALVYSVSFVKQPKISLQDKKIAVNELSLIEQKQKKKEIKPKKKPKKVEPKKEKVVKKPIKKAKSLLKAKKTKPKVLKKIQPKPKEKRAVQQKEPKLLKQEEKQQPKMVKKIPKPSYEKWYVQEHLKKIIALIQKNMKYPRRAKRFNVQGEVVVEFVLNQKGEVQNLTPIKGHRLLKKSAINAIKEASKEFPKVKKSLKLRVPIVYKLT